MKHVHLAGSIRFHSKQDSVVVSCMRCNKEDIFPIWWNECPKGWSKKQWPKLKAAICLYLDSVNESKGIKSGNFEDYCLLKTTLVCN